MDVIKINDVMKAIDDEPEFPGKMPKEMELALQKAMQEQDLDLLIELMKISVRLSKEGIKERVRFYLS